VRMSALKLLGQKTAVVGIVCPIVPVKHSHTMRRGRKEVSRMLPQAKKKEAARDEYRVSMLVDRAQRGGKNKEAKNDSRRGTFFFPMWDTAL